VADILAPAVRAGAIPAPAVAVVQAAVILAPAVAVVQVAADTLAVVGIRAVEGAEAIRQVVEAVIPVAAGTPTVASPTDNDSKTRG
jgi:hypothetical protein